MRVNRPETNSEPRARPRFGIGAAIVLVIVVLVIAVLISALAPRGSTQLLPAGAVPSSSASRGTTAGSGSTGGALGNDSVGPLVLVHVLGQVQRPGLYELHQGDRVVDALAAAGGFTDTADREQQNLARLISDGEQLRVPAIGELPPAGPPGSGGTGLTASGLVNINTADAAALETLPRVGPATAQKILDYRDANGPFSQIDDLMEVTGIGEATFAGMEDKVTV
jgi:competence protein ComEA